MAKACKNVLKLVTLRGPSAKHFWDGLDRLNEQLEKLLEL